MRKLSSLVAILCAAYTTACTSKSSSEQIPTTPKEIQEQRQKDCYAVLSGDWKTYKDSTDARISIEQRLGLTTDEIGKLGHDFYDCNDIPKYVSVVSQLKETVPSRAEVIREFKDKYVPAEVLEYGIVGLKLDLNGMRNLLTRFEYVADTRGISPMKVRDYVYGSYVGSKMIEPVPTPEQVIALDRAIYENSLKYDGCHIDTMLAKGYTYDNLIEIGKRGIFPCDSLERYRDFKELGVTKAEDIIRMADKYGSDIATVIKNAGLTLADLPFIDKVGVANVNGYVIAGFEGKKAEMGNLFNNGVTGQEARSFSSHGIKGEAVMIYLHRQGITGANIDEMETLGFLSGTPPYRIGQVLTANAIYRQHRDALLKGGLLHPSSNESTGSTTSSVTSGGVHMQEF